MPTAPAPSPVPPVLTKGQWEALLFQTPESVKHLVMLLAVHHGAIGRPSPEQCPLCGKRDEAEQKKLFG
jgi:hypothetical protein